MLIESAKNMHAIYIYSAGKLDALSFEPTNAAGRLLDVDFEYSGTLWPWSGFLAIYLRLVMD